MSPLPIAGFHAHVYYEPSTRASAEALHALVGERLTGKLRYFGKLIDRPIGPHPVPMFEIDFHPQNFIEVVSFLMNHHGAHSILIHPETGNDLLDHSKHALWMGKQLELKLEIFG